MGKNSLPATLYSGYGPIEYSHVSKGSKLKANAAIQAGEQQTLRLAFPEGSSIEQVLSYAHQFGTVGSRSRNGWGSVEILGNLTKSELPVRPWKQAIQLPWAHALGSDEQGLLYWISEPQPTWEKAMHILAQARADMRRKVPNRLFLSYPSTKYKLREWGGKARVPNSLRFKVRSHDQQFIACVFHLPCRPPDELWRKLDGKLQNEFSQTFKAAHAFLDKHFQLSRHREQP